MANNNQSAHMMVLRVTMVRGERLSHRVINTIQAYNAVVIAIDVSHIDQNSSTRDITIDMAADVKPLLAALRAIPGVQISHLSDPVFLLHLGGKIEMRSKDRITDRGRLAMAYTPGVARVCQSIAADPASVYNLTMKRNMVAIITDGSAVLGLGNIGPEAALPVMEGKAMLLKDFAGVDAFPICLDTQDTDELIKTIKYMAPCFGAINLEDIAAPRCFEIEKALDEALDIPVFHDDQHGTAIVMAAALMNSLKLVHKKVEDIKVVISGVGAAGFACMKMLKTMGVTNILGCDREGIVSLAEPGLSPAKQDFAKLTGVTDVRGNLSDAIVDADVFIGVSGPNVLTVNDIKTMAKDPIVFAMANPDPEIDPKLAAPHVAVMATGRSDYPNQINNVLAFPGVFRGALDCRARSITPEMHLAAAHAIANVVDQDVLSPDYIIPSVFDKNVVKAVSRAVIEAAAAQNNTTDLDEL